VLFALARATKAAPRKSLEIQKGAVPAGVGKEERAGALSCDGRKELARKLLRHAAGPEEGEPVPRPDARVGGRFLPGDEPALQGGPRVSTEFKFRTWGRGTADR